MRLSSGSPQWRRRIGRRAGPREAPYTRCAVQWSPFERARAPMAVAVLTRYDALRERAGDGDEEALPSRRYTSESAIQKGVEAKGPQRAPSRWTYS